MSITDIRNKHLRRGIIVVGFIPIIVASVVLEVTNLLWEMAKEIPGLVAIAWRGR